MEVNILGTEYSFVHDTKELTKSGNDGICQQYSKRIAVREVSDMLDDTGDMKAKKLRYNEVCRHEAIHAFFGEAGLEQYNEDETLVSFLAVNFPKMDELFKKQGWLGLESEDGKMNRIQIKVDESTEYKPKVLIDGNKVQYVSSVNFSTLPGEVPSATIEVLGSSDIDSFADVRFDVSPDNLHTACRIIRDELLKHGDFYKSFVASVRLAILEAPQECWPVEMAERIVERISGEDKLC